MRSLNGGGRVLIVDDDLTALDALSDMLALRMSGVRIDTCSNAKSALEKLSAEDYDTVITDIKMPGMDGLALTRGLREIAPDVPAILITGHGQLDLAIQAVRAGAFDFVQKPLDRDHLVAALGRAIETRQLRREVKQKQEALQAHASELEQRVEERTAELTRALRAKDEFLALVSHELRNPVSVISGNIELLARLGDKLGEEEIAASMTDLRREGRRLLRLIQNILTLARVEFGAKNEAVPLSVSAMIKQQVEAHVQMHPERRVEVRIAPGLPPVACDELSLELVLGNLLANAQKYSPPKEPIEIQAYADKGHAIVTVYDRGPGVSAEDERRIFDPFYRSERANGIEGLGIGLAVCRRLLEAYGGRIWLARREGGGSEFSFSLPLADEGPTARVPETRPADKPELETTPNPR